MPDVGHAHALTIATIRFQQAGVRATVQYGLTATDFYQQCSVPQSISRAARTSLGDRPSAPARWWVWVALGCATGDRRPVASARLRHEPETPRRPCPAAHDRHHAPAGAPWPHCPRWDGRQTAAHSRGENAHMGITARQAWRKQETPTDSSARQSSASRHPSARSHLPNTASGLPPNRVSAKYIHQMISTGRGHGGQGSQVRKSQAENCKEIGAMHRPA